MKYVVFDEVYPPSEDTFILSSVIGGWMRGKKVLDMGTGSGYLAVLSALNGAFVTASDIRRRALLNTRINAKLNGVRIKTIWSDLFDRIKGTFDVILFNPPYLEPLDCCRSANWDGGKELIKRFLKEAKNHIHRSSVIFTVYERPLKAEELIDIGDDYCYIEREFINGIVLLGVYPCRQTCRRSLIQQWKSTGRARRSQRR